MGCFGVADHVGHVAFVMMVEHATSLCVTNMVLPVLCSDPQVPPVWCVEGCCTRLSGPCLWR